MTVLVAPRPQARRASETRHALVATAHVRLMMLLLVFAAGVLAIVGRLGIMALTSEPASARDIGAALIPPRADIVDRNGAPLARTIQAYAIQLFPQKVINDRKDLSIKLAGLFPEHDATFYYGILTSKRTFFYLKRRALPELVNQMRLLGEPGIEAVREPERLYPQSTLAAHVLGYLDYDGHGVTGMEKVLDHRLLDPTGRAVPASLSIDLRVQEALESELGNAMNAFQAQGAAGVVLDVHTGEVVAMVSLPSFNPNVLNGSPQPNHVTQSVFELGSTFKPIAVAAAIDDGVVTDMSRRFDATKPLQVGRFTIHDDRGDEQRRWLNIPETLIYSSNIATSRIADELGAERLQGMFRKLDFDRRPSIELAEKSRPLWPGFWARTTVMTTAYGHGIAVTPLHLASAYAALVNGGTWRPATLMKVAPGKADPGRRVISPATSARMRQLLRLVVLDGTGKKGEAPGYRVGGKTGTAEIAQGGGYNKKSNVSTFAAAFPMDAPRYVVVAMLEAPKGNKQSFGLTTAAWTSAPVVGRVISRTGMLLGVTPDQNKDVDLRDLMPLIWRGSDPTKAKEE